MAETQVSQGRGVLCSHGTGRIEDEMVDAVYVPGFRIDLGTSLVVQWLRLQVSNAGGLV